MMMMMTLPLVGDDVGSENNTGVGANEKSLGWKSDGVGLKFL